MLNFIRTLLRLPGILQVPEAREALLGMVSGVIAVIFGFVLIWVAESLPVVICAIPISIGGCFNFWVNLERWMRQ